MSLMNIKNKIYITWDKITRSSLNEIKYYSKKAILPGIRLKAVRAN